MDVGVLFFNEPLSTAILPFTYANLAIIFQLAKSSLFLFTFFNYTNAINLCAILLAWHTIIGGVRAF